MPQPIGKRPAHEERNILSPVILHKKYTANGVRGSSCRSVIGFPGMTRGCLRVAIFLGAACLTAAADPPVVTIPALSPPPVIDGQPFDEFWQKALILRLTSSGPMPLGGESRVAISGHFLCLSARLPRRIASWRTRQGGIPPGGLKISSPGTFVSTIRDCVGI